MKGSFFIYLIVHFVAGFLLSREELQMTLTKDPCLSGYSKTKDQIRTLEMELMILKCSSSVARSARNSLESFIGKRFHFSSATMKETCLQIFTIVIHSYPVQICTFLDKKQDLPYP
ncbi:hypothetical protein M9H77_24511 [Catharanthus roseus]|uniref:Uncharacterized protein n=1 Tax=Catharanthus roseus TaxID=4058 RepID=A0ACC0AW08_CATRO|nr:hypothetical protein M9H77_24511 [Catharanthus roseus]